MGIIPIYVWNHLPSADNRDGIVPRSEQSVLPEIVEERKLQFQRLTDLDPYFIERFLRLCRLFRAVYCPSTARHIESAALICELLNLPRPVPDPRLNAIDYGKFKGKPLAEMGAPHEYVDKPYPGGESWLQCRSRWESFFQDALQTHDGRPVLLAGQTRAGIRMCAHLCEGMNLGDAVDLDVNDPTVSWVYFYRL
jgi:broad specificity phosphatase PhoE